MDYKEDISHISSDVCEAINGQNEQIHPIPKLLIKNLHSKTDEDTPLASDACVAVQGQCPYCREIYYQHAPAVYIEHLQTHLDKINEKIKRSAAEKKREFKFLKSSLREQGWNISVRSCARKSCNYIYIDLSAKRKHELIVHQHQKFVCQKVGCNLIFPDKGKLRSHEIVDHTKIGYFHPSDTNNVLSSLCDKAQVPAATASVNVCFDKHESQNSKIKINKRNGNNKCAYCEKEFPTPSELKSHMICAHPGMPTKYKAHSEIKFDLNGARENRTDKNKMTTNNVCADCGNQFSTASKLKSHMICDHPVLSTSSKIYAEAEFDGDRTKNDVMLADASSASVCSIKPDDYSILDVSDNSGTAKRSRNFANVTETIEISAGIVRKFAKSSKNVRRKVKELCKTNRDTFAPSANPYEKTEHSGTANEEMDVFCNLESGENCKVKHVSKGTNDNTSVVEKLSKAAKNTCDKTGTESESGIPLDIEENEQSVPVLSLDSPYTDTKTTESDHSSELQNKRIKLDTTDRVCKLSDEQKQEPLNKINNVRNHGQEKEYMEKVKKEYNLHEQVRSLTFNELFDSEEARQQHLEKEKYRTSLFSCNDPTCTRSFATTKDKRLHVAKQHLKASSSMERMEISKSLPALKRIVACVPDDVKEALGVKLFGVPNQTFSQDGVEKNSMSKSFVDHTNSRRKPLGKIVNEVEELYMDNDDKQFDRTSGDGFDSEIFCICCKLPFESVESKMLHQRQMEEKAYFPCKSAGCEVVCLSNEDRKKHVEEAHLVFQPYLAKFRCNFPGCFKGFYRKFDLHDHYGFKICFKDFDRLSEKMLSDLNVDITAVKTNLELLSSLTTEDLSYICEYENVERDKGSNANINLVWHVCPLKPCGFGSRKKAAIYEHLRARHEYVLKKS